jgi:hypothetical protein
MKPKVGDIVEVEFLDHVEDASEPYLFKVWGRIDKINKDSYSILSWAHAAPGDGSDPHNEKRFTIVTSTIKKLTHLVPKLSRK